MHEKEGREDERWCVVFRPVMSGVGVSVFWRRKWQWADIRAKTTMLLQGMIRQLTYWCVGLAMPTYSHGSFVVHDASSTPTSSRPSLEHFDNVQCALVMVRQQNSPSLLLFVSLCVDMVVRTSPIDH